MGEILDMFKEIFRNFTIAMSLVIGVSTAGNYLANNREIKTPDSITIIKPHHLIGHQEYVKFKNGGEEFRYHPVSIKGERHCFNFDNDNKIDRIDRKAWWQRARYVDTLERDKVNALDKPEFYLYDKVLKNFKEKYKKTIERLAN